MIINTNIILFILLLIKLFMFNKNYLHADYIFPLINCFYNIENRLQFGIVL